MKRLVAQAKERRERVTEREKMRDRERKRDIDEGEGELKRLVAKARECGRF